MRGLTTPGATRSRAVSVAGWLLLVVVVLVAASLGTRYLAHRADVAAPGTYRAGTWLAVMKLFDVNSEANVPAWVSSSLLLAGAAMAGLVGVVVRRSGGPDVGRWFALSGVLGLLSVDEAAGLHERLGGPTQAVLGGAAAVPHFGWVIPGAVLAVVVGVAFIGFLGRVPGPIRGHFLGAGLTFLAAAAGLETVGGAVLDAQGDRAGYLLVTAAEEGGEMVASVWFLYGVMSCLALATATGGRYELALSRHFQDGPEAGSAGAP